MTELRIVQRFCRIKGEQHNTRYTIQQKTEDGWQELPVTFQWEDDPEILKFLKADAVPEDDDD